MWSTAALSVTLEGTQLSEKAGIESLQTSSERAEFPLDAEARASIVAFARSLEVFDPPASHRSALRADIADRLAQAAEVPLQDRVDAICGALLSEVSILFTHVQAAGAVDVVPDPASAVLAASVLGRLPGLAGTARAIRHQYERWDGSGGPHGLRGSNIPMSSRLLALSATLVGHPQHGSTPNWAARNRRVSELLGSALDPDLRSAISQDIESTTPMANQADLDTVLESLNHFVATEHDTPIEALVSIDAAVRAIDRMPAVLLVIGEHARRALESTTVAIGCIIHETSQYQTLLNIGHLDSDTEQFPTAEFHNDKSRPGFQSILQGQGYIRAVDEGHSADPATASLHIRGLRSEAAWPILINEEVWGIVAATTDAASRSLTHGDLATLRLVATHIATAIVQSQHIAEYEELAFTDPLTGLGNRRVLERKLAEIFRRSAVDRQDVSLIMCDVDGLKTVNDSLGHSAGDELLVDAAESLSRAAETVTNSTVCRIGGDEFCVILDGGGMLSSHPVTDMALDLFAQSGSGRSMSCGVAVATTEVQSPGELLRRADVAQYEQKRIRKGLPPAPEDSPERDRRRTRRDT